jgi:hypothetical protein
MLIEAGAHLGETDKRVALGIGMAGGKEEQEIWKLAGLEVN